MRALIPLAAAALLAGAPAASAQSTAPSTAPSADPSSPPAADAPAGAGIVDTQSFIDQAGSSNRMELEASRMALARGLSDGVQPFAERMIADHTAAAAAMKTALEQVDMTAATAEPALLPAHRQMLDALEAASGEAFEALYVSQQAEAHREAVALFSNYARSGDSPSLKEFAKATLPTLRAHEKEAAELQAAQQR